MLQFTQPVKFLKVDTRSGISTKTGKPYEMKEAVFFVPDLGRIKIPVNGNPKMPEPDSIINVSLSVDQGSFQSMRVVYDDASRFAAVK
jgi:hypothetical protein